MKHLVQQRRIEAIQKRIDHLRRRVEVAKAEGKNLSYDRQECAALEWALAIVLVHLEKESRVA